MIYSYDLFKHFIHIFILIIKDTNQWFQQKNSQQLTIHNWVVNLFMLFVHAIYSSGLFMQFIHEFILVDTRDVKAVDFSAASTASASASASIL